MPIERKAWACAWNCGGRVTTSRKRMEFHEARCFHNPARRACQTCANFDRRNGCLAENGPVLEEAGMQYGCQWWSNKALSESSR
jgi:hypothetical protein